MNQQRIYTAYEAQAFRITITGNSAGRPVRVIISDANQANTEFINREVEVNGKQLVYAKMPLTPKVALVEVQGLGVKMEAVERVPLERKMDVVDMAQPEIREAVEFFQRIAYNAGTMQLGTYRNATGRYTLDFIPVVLKKDGSESSAAAAIYDHNGHIEFSQVKNLHATVPARIVRLFHEMSHYFLNAKKASETEADLNALLIYLGLGYPKQEAYEAFVDSFNRVPKNFENAQLYEENKKRIAIIERFIDDFDKNNLLLYDQ